MVSPSQAKGSHNRRGGGPLGNDKKDSDSSEETEESSDSGTSEEDETNSSEEDSSSQGSTDPDDSTTTATTSSEDSDESISNKGKSRPGTAAFQTTKRPISSLDRKFEKTVLTGNSVRTGSHHHHHHKNHKESKKDNGGGDVVVVSSARHRRRRQRPMTICLTHCRYELVRKVSQRYGLIEVTEDTAWNIYWTDYSVSLERAIEMHRFQIVNHFPGMNEICRKDLLARNLNRMKRVFPDEYNIYPMTWCLPADNNELQAYSQSRRGKTYICKPEMGCQGRGIFLVKNIKDLNPFGRIICQIYIQKPFLIDHLKFDLRMYVLITSCDPLRVYIYKEGLARFATAKYRKPTQNNTENSYMHLTNYAVNKFSQDFVVDEDTGTKRKLTNVYNWLEQRGYDVETLEKEIDDVIMKTILSAQPLLKHHYRSCFPHHDICSACFEILGFDILLDHKLKPFVIEVNHSPSFHTDTKMDQEIKDALLHDTFAMLHFKQLNRNKIEKEDRRRVQERLLSKLNENKSGDGKKDANNRKKGEKSSESRGKSPPTPNYNELAFKWEVEHCGNYRLVYPQSDSDKYDKFLAQNPGSLYQETASSQARANLTRAQMEEYNQKKQVEEQKRFGGISANRDLMGSKEKVRPESPNSVTPPELQKPKKKIVQKKIVFNSLLPVNPSNGCENNFSLCHIVTEEDCERVRSLIQRGLLIRSLGIELQAYRLLCKVGNLKKGEHEDFRRKHGFSLASYQTAQPTLLRNDLFTYPTHSNSYNSPNQSRQEFTVESARQPPRTGTAANNSSLVVISPINPGSHQSQYLTAKLVHHQRNETAPRPPLNSMFTMRWHTDRNLNLQTPPMDPLNRPSQVQSQIQGQGPLTLPPPYNRLYQTNPYLPSGSRPTSRGELALSLPTGAAQIRAIAKGGPNFATSFGPINRNLLNRNAFEIQQRYNMIHDRKLVNALSALSLDFKPRASTPIQENANNAEYNFTVPATPRNKTSPENGNTARHSPKNRTPAQKWNVAASLSVESSFQHQRTRTAVPRGNSTNSAQFLHPNAKNDNNNSKQMYHFSPFRNVHGDNVTPTQLGRLLPNQNKTKIGGPSTNLESSAVIFPRRGNTPVNNISGQPSKIQTPDAFTMKI